MNVEAGMGTDTLAQAIIVNKANVDDGDPHYAPEEHGLCANCGTILTGRYCHSCGQSAHIHRSLLHMVEELLHGIFHFETKAWRTIPALIFTPGKLTRNYIAGQRTRYVSPLALFLFLIFLMFFVFSMTASHSGEDLIKAQGKANTSVSKELDDAKANLNNLNTERATLAKDDKRIVEIDEEISASKIEIAILEVGLKEKNKDATTDDKTGVTQNKKINENLTADDEIDLKNAFGLTVNNENIATSVPWLNKTLKHATQNPELTLYKMKSAASKFAFLLMPISLPFLWFMFIFKRKYVMFDHAVFSLYSLCFMAILMMFITILGRFNLGGVAGFFTVVAPPVHMFAQLRGTYALSKMEALWRTVALLFIALISLTIYALLVAGLSM